MLNRVTTSEKIMSLNFSSIPSRIEEVFSFIRVSSAGRSKLREFLPRYFGGHIQVRVVSKIDDIQGVSESSLAGTPAAALICDEARRTLFVQENVELGLLAPLFFHEMVHSVDEDYVSSFSTQQRLWSDFYKKAESIIRDVGIRQKKKCLELREKDLRVAELDEIRRLRDLAERFDHVRCFLAERKAYSELHAFVGQLCNRLPGYREYLVKQRENGYCLDRPISDDEIVSGYRLKRKYV